MRCRRSSKCNRSPRGDDDLAVDHAALERVGLHGRHDLGEVAGERALVAAAQLDLVAVPEDDAAEAVPLGLVERVVADGELGCGLGQHRLHRRLHGEIHAGQSSSRLPLRSRSVLACGVLAGGAAIPLLPCASIDEIADFAAALGFAVTYRQVRPNPYLALRREGIELHYFGMEGFRPEDSYGTCVVIAPDPKGSSTPSPTGSGPVRTAAPGGFPRITRPRRGRTPTGSPGSAWSTPAATGSA